MRRDPVPLTGSLLALAGLGVSIYLTIAHYGSASVLACPNSGLVNCQKVTTSAESVILGVPVAVLGLVFFVAMVGLNLPRAWRSPDPRVRMARMLLSIAGIGFVLWFLYAEFFLIGSVCLWCSVVHAMAFGLFVLAAFTWSRPAPAPAPRRGASGARGRPSRSTQRR